MKKLLIIIPLVFLLCFIFGCQKQTEVVAEEPAVDVDAEKANIRMIFDQYSEAWKSSNMDQFNEIFAHDADIVIIDSQTRYDGGEAWLERLKNSFTLIEDVNVTFRDHSIKVHRLGTVAWLATLEDATWTEEGQPNEVTGMRVTWVLEKRESKWVIVQGHWSVSELQVEE